MNLHDLMNAKTRKIKPMSESNAGISRDQETKFHSKLDTLVHDTFGKRKDEMTEGDSSVGDAILSLYNQIYELGDDAVDHLYHNAPLFAQFWDQYEGDIESIIAEVSPKNLIRIKQELEVIAKEEGLMEYAAGDDEGGSNDDAFFKYAKMWYNGDTTTQDRVADALAKAGWEIGELESEEGGAFIVQSGDEDGKTYMGWSAEELQGVDEARANTAGARAGLAKRKDKKPLSPEEQLAKDKAKADKWLEKERAKMAAKKGVAEGSESDRIQALYDKLESMEERLGSDDPRVQAIKDQIRGLSDQYRVTGQNTANSLRGVDEESSPETSLHLLKGLKTWQVVIMNNYYRGKYSDYSGRYYYVLASSPEEAKQVVINNADAILQELLAMKAHNGKKILPRGTAVRITPERINGVKDGTEAGRMSTAGFKKMFGPQGPMMVKLSGGAVVDVQGQEQGVAEGWDPDTTRLEQDVRDALENGDDYTAKQYAKMAPTPEAKKYLLNIIKQAMYIDDLGGETDWKGVAEAAKKAEQDKGQVNELKKSTLASYAKKAANSMDTHAYHAYRHQDDSDYDKKEKRKQGIGKAVDRLAKEQGVAEVAAQELDEVSRGDYYKKATMSKAMAQMSAGFAKSPEEKEKFNQIAGRRERGLGMAKARTDKFWADKNAKDEAERLEQLRAKYAGVDIDAEIARLKPAIQSAYHEFQYGARNTYGQGRDDYNRLMAQVQELERAKAALAKGNGINEGSSDLIGNAIEDLRASKPGMDQETFLDELYFYIDAEWGKNAADQVSNARQDDWDDWYYSYNDGNEGVKLSELSNELLGAYKKAAGISARDLDKAGKYKQADKRFHGIVQATKKELDNDMKKHQQDEMMETRINMMRKAGYDL